MPSQSFPFAVRLIGFSSLEEEAFDAACAAAADRSYAYLRLADDNLRDPDMYVVNANDTKALAALPSLHPGPMRPALLVGARKFDLPFSFVDGVINSPLVFSELDKLVLQRADALSRLQSSDVVIVPERRRRARTDEGLDPSVYERMRVKRHETGAVLVVDKTDVFRDYLAEMMERYKVPVVWTDNETEAVRICREQTIAVVMINTSAQDVDPYRLCWAVKEKDAPVKMTVILLVGQPAEYDTQQAGYVGVDGYLIKPVLPQHLLSALKKFMNLR
jgi:CheY-like chemotaxis protein